MKSTFLMWVYFFFIFINALPLYATVEYITGEHHIYNNVDEDIWIGDGSSNPVEVTLHSGIINGNVYISSGSPFVTTFSMLGGEIQGYLETMHGTTTEIFDGTISQRVGAFMQSKILIYGGNISHDVYANTGGEIHLWGTNFNFPYGEISGSSGILTGTLLNGDPIDCSFERYIDPWETNPSFIPKIILHPIPEPTIQVPIDIKPTSCPNPLNLKSKGVLPVAILGSDSLNVEDIDFDTILLEGVAPIRSSYEDVATSNADTTECSCTTEGPDGYIDLTLKFDTQEIVAALGEVSDGDNYNLHLSGLLYDGTEIEGSDCVVIKKKGKKNSDISKFMNDWLMTGQGLESDLNNDNRVDMRDLAILAGSL